MKNQEIRTFRTESELTESKLTWIGNVKKASKYRRWPAAPGREDKNMKKYGYPKHTAICQIIIGNWNLEYNG